MSSSFRNLLVLAAFALGRVASAEDKPLTVTLHVPPSATAASAAATETMSSPISAGEFYSGEVASPVYGSVVAPPRYPWASVIHQPLNFATPVPYDTGYFGFASTYYGKAYPNYSLYPGVRHSPFPYYYPSSRSTPNPEGPSTAALWPGYYYGYGYGFGYGYPYWPGANGTNPYGEGYNPFLR